MAVDQFVDQNAIDVGVAINSDVLIKVLEENITTR